MEDLNKTNTILEKEGEEEEEEKEELVGDANELHSEFQSCDLTIFASKNNIEVKQILFFRAAQQNKLSHLKILVKEKEVKINWTDKMDRSAVLMAAANGHYKAMSFLINQGAHVYQADKFGMTPLHWAAYNGHPKCLIKLCPLFDQQVDNQTKQGHTILHLATINNFSNIVQFICDCLKGFNLNLQDNKGKTALHLASENGFNEILEVLIKAKSNVNSSDKLGQMPIHLVCKNGKFVCCKKLIKAKALLLEHDENGYLPLHYASLHNQLKIIKFLASKIELNKLTTRNENCLMLAVEEGHVDMTKYLLQSPYINCNQQDNNGNTVFHLCAKKKSGNHWIIMKELLLYPKSDINILNNYNESPLHLSIQHNNTSLVELLCIAGADIYTKTKYGKNILELAMKCDETSIVDVIIKTDRVQKLLGNKLYFNEKFKRRRSSFYVCEDDNFDEESDVSEAEGGEDDLEKMNSDTPNNTNENINFGQTIKSLDQTSNQSLSQKFEEKQEKIFTSEFVENMNENSVNVAKETWTRVSLNNSHSSIERDINTYDTLDNNVNEMKQHIRQTLEDSENNINREEFGVISENSVNQFNLNKSKQSIESSLEDLNLIKKQLLKDLMKSRGELSNQTIIYENTDQNDKKYEEDEEKDEFEMDNLKKSEEEEDENDKHELHIHNKKASNQSEENMASYEKGNTSSTSEINTNTNERNVANMTIIVDDSDLEVESEDEKYSEIKKFQEKVDNYYENESLPSFLVEDQKKEEVEEEDHSSDFGSEKYSFYSNRSNFEENFGDEFDKDLSNEDNMKLKIFMWKFAKKYMNNRKWIHLAYSWNFTDEQIRAIQYHYLKTDLLATQSYRLLVIWFESIKLLKPGENPSKELHEALVLSGYSKLASKLRKMLKKSENEKKCTIS